MNFRPFLSLSLAVMAAIPSARPELSLAPLFSDRAVLQCDKPLPVWGRATPREKIVVSFRGQVARTTTDADGRWIVYLEPVPASTEPADLIVEGAERIVLSDVLVGEVWLAAGQSNMEWPVSHLEAEEQRMAQVDLPLVRHLRIEHAVAAAPAETAKTSGWQAASPQSVGGFTAVGYFFARELHRRLGVPVGIVHSSWGGTVIESWMSDASRAGTSLAGTIEARWQQAMSEWTPERIARYPADLEAWQQAEDNAKTTKTKNPLPWPQPPATPDSPARPGGLFNAMIAPLQPGALRGVLWYQGESNVGRAAEYAELFPAMIRAWRANWGDDALPFYFVQLPNYGDDNPTGRQWARLREAQTAALKLPATAMAVAIDVGDAENLHPTNKAEIGRRLALLARSQIYGFPGDTFSPTYASAARDGTAIRVKFNHANTGLVAHLRPVQSLEIAGADKVFHPAVGKIDRDTLLVSSPKVKEPVAVRYAWSNAPVANLFSGAGLPVAPFRSDDW
ncbi:MAG TPA: sialate O-acetylesterase [Opitutus sp.]|nr:sialate O-acetylesterase [Opitutus sp.]